jgi:hypothetical protein
MHDILEVTVYPKCGKTQNKGGIMITGFPTPCNIGTHPMFTSHTRLRACDHYTWNTLIGRKNGAGPSSLSHYAWGTNGVCECKMDVKSTWIPTRHWMDHVWRLAWIEIHWNSICLRAPSHMTSHYTWDPWPHYMILEGVLGRPLDTFFWALTISWSRLLARVWSGPQWLLKMKESPWYFHDKLDSKAFPPLWKWALRTLKTIL